MPPLPILIVTAITLVSQGPPTPTITPRTIRSSNPPASPLAIVTYVVKGEGRQASDLLFVVWRGQADWYRASPRSSSGGGSGSSFSDTATYGDVRTTLIVDFGNRVAHVQGIRVEFGESNVILVDDVDRPQSTRVVGTLRVEASGPLGTSPDAPLRLLGPSQDVVDFLGCSRPDAGSPTGTPRYCWMVVGKEGKQE